ncbi:tyrosine--tRNA ligase [Candidatus Micrarchaeota archaeon CG10_big_fil_rev_8_21_14_0_10_45_29]|nr:MAG: tyrosine--tRNA ligase [Candidatus Micrarchaeota archaeon CG10_big_fil_rev_8_21_14_0_10_45_29]
MDIDSKLELVKKGSIQEIITEDELRSLFEREAHPKHYIGFEISGLVHLGTGLLTAIKIKDFMEAGIKPTIFLADYHGWINGKLGGDLQKAQEVAKGYFKQCFVSLGLEEGKVNYVLGSKLYEKLGNDYWADVLKIAKDTSMARMLRCTTIMGRDESEKLPSSAFLYPAMQAADVWALDVDIMQAGMDQRKVHMLSREMADKYKKKKAVAIHGKLLGGLKGPKRMDANIFPIEQKPLKEGEGFSYEELKDKMMLENKMSKSKPDSCIFVHDSVEEIQRKMKKAHCPEKEIENNPIIDYAQAFVLRDKPLKIERPEKFGGNVEFANEAELKKAFMEGKLHPVDLKNAVARELIEMLEPCRKYFEKHVELVETVTE